MEPGVLAAVLIAALVHASWNAIAKGQAGVDPLDAALSLTIGGAVMAVPLLALTGLPATESHAAVAASGVVHLAYFVLVGLIYRGADYAVAYPIMRGMPPVITAVAAAAWLGEWLTWRAGASVGAIAAGVLLIGWRSPARARLETRTVLLIAAIVAVIVGYTLLDGIGGRLSGNGFAYVVAMMLATGVLALPVAWRRWTVTGYRPSHASLALSAAAGTMVMISYGIAVWAMTRAPIGLVAALRETSVLFAVLIGRIVLGERIGGKGMAGAGLIVAGLALIRFA